MLPLYPNLKKIQKQKIRPPSISTVHFAQGFGTASTNVFLGNDSLQRYPGGKCLQTKSP